MTTLTVSELNQLIKETFISNFSGPVSITGEISNIRLSSGHAYLSIKDKMSLINCIIWKNKYLELIKKSIEINNSDIVIATGTLNIYSKSGTYSFHISEIKKKETKKTILNEYEKIKIKCESLGYFNNSNKKKLPNFIKKIGIITAINSAALQDILYVFKNKNINSEIFISDCKVQGNECSLSVIDALKKMALLNPDVVIIARGGGSFEDLFGFCNEQLIKIIYEYPIVTISAIGHEIDNMLTDFAADIRAPTPSIAAEIVSNINNHLLNKIEMTKGKTKMIMQNKLNDLKNKIELTKQILINNEPDKIPTKLPKLKLTHNGNLITKLEDFLDIIKNDNIFKLSFGSKKILVNINLKE